MLVIENITKQFKAGHPVFKNLNFTFQPGYGVGIIGPNGSGKTTFLRLLSVTSFPTSGEITWNGKSIHKEPRSFLNQVGLVHDEEGLPKHLTAVELLEWILRSRGLWSDQSVAEIDSIFDLLALEDRRDPIGTYSTGMKKKTQLAAAFIVNPKVLILDEPLRGLDKETREVILKMIMDLKSEKKALIFMASHFIGTDSHIFDEIIEFPVVNKIHQK